MLFELDIEKSVDEVFETVYHDNKLGENDLIPKKSSLTEYGQKQLIKKELKSKLKKKDFNNKVAAWWAYFAVVAPLLVMGYMMFYDYTFWKTFGLVFLVEGFLLLIFELVGQLVDLKDKLFAQKRE